MPDFRMQNNFPIASVIDAAQRKGQLDNETTLKQSELFNQSLGAIGTIGKSLMDQKKQVAQALALGRQFDIPDDVAKTMQPDQILKVGAIKKGFIPRDLVEEMLFHRTITPSASAASATTATPGATPAATPNTATAPTAKPEAVLASASPTIPMPAQGQPDSNIGLPPGLTAPATGQVPVPISAPPTKPQMLNPATINMMMKLRDVPVESQADALKAGHMTVGTKLIAPSAMGSQMSWSQASPEQQAQAKALYEGRMRPGDVGFRDRTAMTSLANQYGILNGLPPYKSYNAEINATMAKSATSGKIGQNALSLNTALGHAASAYDSYQALGNTNQEWLNVPLNELKKKTNDPNVVALGINLNALRGELSNVFKNTGGTDQEIASWREYLNENLTPSQVISAMSKVDELLRSRVDALNYQKSQAGGDGNSLLSPHAKVISKKLSSPGATQSGGWTPAQEARYQELLAKQKNASK